MKPLAEQKEFLDNYSRGYIPRKAWQLQAAAMTDYPELIAWAERAQRLLSIFEKCYGPEEMTAVEARKLLAEI